MSETYHIRNRTLVRWLLYEGAEIGNSCSFVLEKGMGERIDLSILSDDTFELTFIGKADLEKEKKGT